MSGDISRQRFDPQDAYRGVRLQQGRVSLDADLNELDEIVDRRDRAQTYDTVGPAVYPTTTPDGFKLAVDPVSGELLIGPGRAYVDGILAECFGDLSSQASITFEPHLEQDWSTAWLPLADQPWRFRGMPAPGTKAGAKDLAYLDVWTREVTVMERPDLREPALGGPDTTTRQQTVWQVKFLDVDPSTACGDSIPDWDLLVQPSTGRLTSRTKPIAPTPGPCVVDPAGGYTGLENRLYRVEVHRAGTLTGATAASFVWSRDNASLTAAVETVTGSPGGSVLTVSSTGRDSWTRFAKDDVLELLDDDIELGRRDRGTGGQLLTITEVLHAAGEIHVAQDLTAYAATMGAHPRVVRWDTDPHTPGQAVERTIAAGTPFDLEEGIQVTFDGAAADTVHVGDHWVFAARTADGTVEELDAKPPRGIHHHFMRLGLVTVGTPPVVDDDCRVPWPPDCRCEGGCECDFCVTPESHESGELTIQDAIDQAIEAGGGTVCLELGTYVIKAGLQIRHGFSIRLRGKGLLTRVLHAGDGPALTIRESLDVRVSDLTLAALRGRSSDLPPPAVAVVNSVRVELDHVFVVENVVGMLRAVAKPATSQPIGAAVALAGLVVDLRVRDSILVGGDGVVTAPYAVRDVAGGVVLIRCVLEDNWIFAASRGIALGSTAAAPSQVGPSLKEKYQAAEPTAWAATALDQIVVERNSVYGCDEAGIALTMWAERTEVAVRSNVIGSWNVGILVGTSGARVHDNTVFSIDREGEVDGHGIVLGGPRLRLLSLVSVHDNLVSVRGAGVWLAGRLRQIKVERNELLECAAGVETDPESQAADLSVTSNSVLATRPREDSVTAFGIMVANADGVLVADNLVLQVATRSDTRAPARIAVGIALNRCDDARVSRNRVDDVGLDQEGTQVLALGIASFGNVERLDIEHNSVRQRIDGQTPSWIALLVLPGGADEPALREVWAPGDDLERYLYAGSRAQHVLIHLGPKGDPAEAEGRRTARLGIHSNDLDTSGRAPVALVLMPAACLVNDNRCLARRYMDIVTRFTARSLALTSNHMIGDDDRLSIQTVVLDGTDAYGNPVPALTAVGNLTSGEIEVNGVSLTAPWDVLNVRV